ncbi:luciferase family oxidoreductase group 1 [Sinobaca qinghaiensis]|uniref:Luciferase family oxidoreductase group 1 n=1 Tax=Sinobaca qinghaiensis TaxID=342944 RepID=A0A419V531_9BACL|nr:LLM class flavin-dependent oxidoreductase [Sinobaca qinghaiensis]RKD73593.1 luciferase family oxidoreductase group 1 [Sinobaca qinghaiensis]
MDHTPLKDIPFSILNLSPVNQNQTIAESMHNSLDLAQHAEKWGYNRMWLAEHHNIDGIASSATSVLMGYIAGGTSTLRVGSGGIMLPNHAPLAIAEQFGTLETLYPDRIDLGLGRAPGSDQLTAMALRRNVNSSDNFPALLEELRSYFEPYDEFSRRVRAIPGEGLDIPVWLLGSSTFSAQLAGQLGLPFAFAGHFAPASMMDALSVYHRVFTPSKVLDKPYAMVGVNVIAADTNEKAEHVASSLYLKFLSLIRNTPGRTQPPVDDINEVWSEREKMAVNDMLKNTFVGDKETVAAKMDEFVKRTGVQELMINSEAYHHEDRLRSFELIAEAKNHPISASQSN